MNIAILGTGYVGLVAGTCFAEGGNHVICVDIDVSRIEKLRRRMVPFYEPGIEELIERNLKTKRLSFSLNAGQAIQTSDIIFIAVGTPSAANGSSNMTAIFTVAEVIAHHINAPKIIVVKSTVPVGTAKKIEEYVKEKTSFPFSIVSNPEFLKEGAAVADFLKPERIVIGTEDPHAIETMKELYEPFVRSGNPILIMDNTTAELSKYACNSYLAMRISFVNEVANFCEGVGANIDHIRKVMMTDSRIGNKFLYPGIGYGGSCFPKDVRAFISSSIEHGKPLKILKAVEEVNDKQKEILFNKVSKYFNGSLQGKTIAIWGVSFKPNTDDIREAPSMSVIPKLLETGAHIHVYDPVALENAKRHFENRINYFQDSYECLRGAHALLIFTEWNEFRKPNFSKMKSLLKHPLILDGRNLYSPKEMKSHGFIYEGIGLT